MLLGVVGVDFGRCADLHLKAGQNTQKRLKMAKKVFRPAFGCAQHPKAGRNTQQLGVGLKRECSFQAPLSLF